MPVSWRRRASFMKQRWVWAFYLLLLVSCMWCLMIQVDTNLVNPLPVARSPAWRRTGRTWWLSTRAQTCCAMGNEWRLCWGRRRSSTCGWRAWRRRWPSCAPRKRTRASRRRTSNVSRSDSWRSLRPPWSLWRWGSSSHLTGFKFPKPYLQDDHCDCVFTLWLEKEVMAGSDWLLVWQAERQSLRLLLERTESELNLSHEQNSQLTGRLHKAERGVNSLTCQVCWPLTPDPWDVLLTMTSPTPVWASLTG